MGIGTEGYDQMDNQTVEVLQWTTVACMAARVLVLDIMRVVRFIRSDSHARRSKRRVKGKELMIATSHDHSQK
jgi:hypothetical protein